MGWAFGLGLERLAMPLFSIPDIRLFWSTDQRFTSQFRAPVLGGGGVLKPQKFKPFSKCVELICVAFCIKLCSRSANVSQLPRYPPCTKDVAFWLPQDAASFHENNLHEAVRQVTCDV